MDREAQWPPVPWVTKSCCDSSDSACVHVSLTLFTPSSAVDSWLGASCPQLWNPVLVKGRPT